MTVEQITLLLCIVKLLGSDLGKDYSHWLIFLGFTRPFQANSARTLKLRPRPSHFIPFPVHHSLFILPVNVRTTPSLAKQTIYLYTIVGSFTDMEHGCFLCTCKVALRFSRSPLCWTKMKDLRNIRICGMNLTYDYYE